MKKIFLVSSLLFGLWLAAGAQYVRVRPGFSVGVSIGAPGPMPYRGAIWIGPEWSWRGGRYVEVPGYWARPRHHRAVWIPGHWVYSRRGYRWKQGRWG
jgi:hypothetical protein